MYYILKNKIPVKCDSIEFAKWYATANRRIAETEKDGVRISTVFLGLDHSMVMDLNTPILFETMVFGGEHDQYQTRYSTYKEAQNGHTEVCKKVGIELKDYSVKLIGNKED
jgi:hypothetical protein